MLGRGLMLRLFEFGIFDIGTTMLAPVFRLYRESVLVELCSAIDMDCFTVDFQYSDILQQILANPSKFWPGLA